jgi:hypothetical protein
MYYCKIHVGDNRQHVSLRLYTYRLGGVAALRLGCSFTSHPIIIVSNDGYCEIVGCSCEHAINCRALAMSELSLPQPLTLENTGERSTSFCGVGNSTGIICRAFPGRVNGQVQHSKVCI